MSHPELSAYQAFSKTFTDLCRRPGKVERVGDNDPGYVRWRSVALGAVLLRATMIVAPLGENEQQARLFPGAGKQLCGAEPSPENAAYIHGRREFELMVHAPKPDKPKDYSMLLGARYLLTPADTVHQVTVVYERNNEPRYAGLWDIPYVAAHVPTNHSDEIVAMLAMPESIAAAGDWFESLPPFDNPAT